MVFKIAETGTYVAEIGNNRMLWIDSREKA